MKEHVRLDIRERVPKPAIPVRIGCARAVGYLILVGGTCFYAVLVIGLTAALIASDTDDQYRPEWTASPEQPLTDAQALWGLLLAEAGNRWFQPGASLGVLLIVACLGSGVLLPRIYPVIAGLAILVIFLIAALGVFNVLVVALPLLLSLAVMPLTMYSEFIGDAVDEARSGRPTEIGAIEQLPGEVRRVKRLSRRVVAPRLAVLRVEPAIWRDVVLKMAGVCRAVVIDVSRPTENIVWEIEQLSRVPHVRCIFIGEYGHLKRINERGPGQSPPVDDTVRLVAGRPVLAYVIGSDGTDFARALNTILAGRCGFEGRN